MELAAYSGQLAVLANGDPERLREIATKNEGLKKRLEEDPQWPEKYLDGWENEILVMEREEEEKGPSAEIK